LLLCSRLPSIVMGDFVALFSASLKLIYEYYVKLNELCLVVPTISNCKD
jgi:hypothetical protein